MGWGLWPLGLLGDKVRNWCREAVGTLEPKELTVGEKVSKAPRLRAGVAGA